MTQYATEPAQEKSTYIVDAAFADAAGDPVVPTSITWTLTNTAGTVINTKQDVAVAAPAASVAIGLSGNDLAIQTGEVVPVFRYLLVESVYTADEGENLTLTDQYKFEIDNMVGVT